MDRCAYCFGDIDPAMPNVRSPCMCKTLMLHPGCLVPFHWGRTQCSVCRLGFTIEALPTFLWAWYLHKHTPRSFLSRLWPVHQKPQQHRMSRISYDEERYPEQLLNFVQSMYKLEAGVRGNKKFLYRYSGSLPLKLDVFHNDEQIYPPQIHRKSNEDSFVLGKAYLICSIEFLQ